VTASANIVDENIVIWDGWAKWVKDSWINKSVITTNTAQRNLVKVSSNDTTGWYLNGKLVAGANVTFVEGTDWGDETLTISASSGGWDTVSTVVNTIKKDSTAWTSTTKGTLAGAINGSNTRYTVSAGIYVTASLNVYRNGKLLTEGTSEDYVETVPWSGTFDFNTAPTTDDTGEISVDYSDQATTTASLIVNKDVQTKTADYTALQTDWIILVNTTSWDVDITLPATSGVDRVGIMIKKVDSTGNVVNILTPWSETIDNESTQVITMPYHSVDIVTDWTNYFIK
jgi:hypothetical protein